MAKRHTSRTASVPASADPVAERLRILIVDDDKHVRTLLARILRTRGHDSDAASTAPEARLLLAKQPADVVLCDVSMPGESGFALLRYLRAEYPLLPVVMVSGIGELEIATAALELGAYGWVTKPFDANQVLIAVHNAAIRAGLERRSASYEQDLEQSVLQRTVELRETVDKLERSQERLAHLVDHDQLTGLFNRQRFEAALVDELRAGGRSGSVGAVLSIDIDNFKAINDAAGHQAGDAVLRMVAAVLSDFARRPGVPARLGGDEFGLLLPAPDGDNARSIAEDLLSVLHREVVIAGGTPFRITASIGVVLFERSESNAHEIVIDADLAMYEAKRTGRDRIVVYTPEEASSARTLARLAWANQLREALEQERFVLHLQPIRELASGRVSHGELLLRMIGRDGELVSPSAFLPAAERFGLIHSIDRWVVRHAIQLLAADDELPPIGVNLSGESVVGDPDLLPLIKADVAAASIDPADLIFEVTETAAIANMVEARRFARSLRQLGCALALDDFGTGFGSFYYLKHLPVDYVKLDGEFIQNLPQSPVDEHVVRAIVDVAVGMGIKTVAEWVSDDATIELLARLGVDYAQGFHIGRPAPVLARDYRKR
jgi:diguanylate cyclase (GGDEF)-like protein